MKEGMPETQAELESLLNDRIQAKTGEAVTNAVKDVMARAGAKRLPDAVDYNKDALGASEDGKFKSRGEFFQKVYEAGNGLGIDPRLMHTRNLGESFGDAGGFLVPEEFRPDLMMIPLEQSIIRPRAFTMPMSSASFPTNSCKTPRLQWTLYSAGCLAKRSHTSRTWRSSPAPAQDSPRASSTPSVW